MGKHKENRGKRSGWKNSKKKWEDEACCSAVDKLSLDQGNPLLNRINTKHTNQTRAR